MAKQESPKTETSARRTPIVRTSAGLRGALFDEMDRVVNDETTPEKANSMARLSGQIVSTVRLELDAHKLRLKSPGGETVPPPLMLGAG